MGFTRLDSASNFGGRFHSVLVIRMGHNTVSGGDSSLVKFVGSRGGPSNLELVVHGIAATSSVVSYARDIYRTANVGTSATRKLKRFWPRTRGRRSSTYVGYSLRTRRAPGHLLVRRRRRYVRKFPRRRRRYRRR